MPAKPLPLPPPSTEAELLLRARALSGRTLAWVAGRHGVVVPGDPRRSKGWAGRLMESVLGASAGSRAEPDFPHLGIELKTLPVDRRGLPRESTYVCNAPLDGSLVVPWESSWVRGKLARVLWILVVGGAEDPVGEKRVGGPLLWSPSPEEEALLRSDWDELIALVVGGEHGRLTAHLGKALQVRPKAAHAREMTWALGDEAEWVRTNPRGFYLRPSFTRGIVARHFVVGG